MSTMKRVYMDHGAGKPVDPHVLDEMMPYMEASFGNPSSIHEYGSESREALDEARRKTGELVNAEDSGSIIFTSGATESNNMAIIGVSSSLKSRRNHVITSSIEHMSVLNPCKSLSAQGFKVSFLPVDRYGFVDVESLKQKLDEATVLVSVMYANGEIGTIQPISEIGEIVHDAGSIIHVDAAAANGQVPIDVDKENIDLLTLSSNDMYGPKGVGALYIRKGVRIRPSILGGGQENGLRSGTENLPGIVGLGKAAEIAVREMGGESRRLIKLRDALITGLTRKTPHAFLNGHPKKRLPNNVAVRYSFIEGESILLNLDMKGVAASSGSACTAKTLEPSHVLRAIGLNHEEAHGSVLFTLGKQNTLEEVDYVTQMMPDIVKRLRAMSPLTPKELLE